MIIFLFYFIYYLRLETRDVCDNIDIIINTIHFFVGWFGYSAQVHRLLKDNESALKDLNSAIEKANGQNWILRQVSFS